MLLEKWTRRVIYMGLGPEAAKYKWSRSSTSDDISLYEYEFFIYLLKRRPLKQNLRLMRIWFVHRRKTHVYLENNYSDLWKKSIDHQPPRSDQNSSSPTSWKTVINYGEHTFVCHLLVSRTMIILFSL